MNISISLKHQWLEKNLTCKTIPHKGNKYSNKSVRRYWQSDFSGMVLLSFLGKRNVSRIDVLKSAASRHWHTPLAIFTWSLYYWAILIFKNELTFNNLHRHKMVWPGLALNQWHIKMLVCSTCFPIYYSEKPKSGLVGIREMEWHSHYGFSASESFQNVPLTCKGLKHKAAVSCPSPNSIKHNSPLCQGHFLPLPVEMATQQGQFYNHIFVDAPKRPRVGEGQSVHRQQGDRGVCKGLTCSLAVRWETTGQ